MHATNLIYTPTLWDMAPPIDDYPSPDGCGCPTINGRSHILHIATTAAGMHFQMYRPYLVGVDP
jgi:hypothetical protein